MRDFQSVEREKSGGNVLQFVVLSRQNTSSLEEPLMRSPGTVVSVPVRIPVRTARRGAGPLYSSSSDANSKENRFANVNSFVLVYEQI